MRSDLHPAVRGSVVFLLGIASACALRAVEPTQRLEELHVALESVGPELVNQIVIARTELRETRDEDGWTPQARSAARQWLDSLLPPEVVDNPGAASPQLHLRRHSRMLANARKPHQLAAPAGVFADNVTARLQHVITLQGRWWSDYCDLVTKVAEKAWLAADAPTDLLPARRTLGRFRALAIDPAPPNDPARAPRPFPVIGLKSNGVNVRFADDEPLSAVLILTGPEPLLLPDPRKDPESYKRARLLWHDLGGWQLRFCERYLVSRRVSEGDMRFQRAAGEAQREFERQIMSEAPADKIAAAWQRVEIFHVATEMPSPGRPANQIPGIMPVRRSTPSPAGSMQRPDFTNSFPADYRELLALPNGKRPSDITANSYFRPVLHPEPYESDSLLVALVIAEAQRDTAEIEQCRTRILSQWPRFSQEMKAWLQKKLGVDPLARLLPKQTPPADVVELLPIPAGVSDFRAVEMVLEDAASPTRKGGAVPQAGELLDQWRGLNATFGGGMSENPKMNWARLSGRPGGVALMTARDRALREVIVRIGKIDPVDEPLPSLLRDRLEAAITAGDWPQYHHLLKIEQVVGVLNPEELNEYRTFGVILSSKAADSVHPQRDCLALLRQSTSPAAAKVAAQRLKTLKEAR